MTDVIREGRAIAPTGELRLQALGASEALPATAQPANGSLLPFGQFLATDGSIYVRFV